MVPSGNALRSAFFTQKVCLYYKTHKNKVGGLCLNGVCPLRFNAVLSIVTQKNSRNRIQRENLYCVHTHTHTHTFTDTSIILDMYKQNFCSETKHTQAPAARQVLEISESVLCRSTAEQHAAVDKKRYLAPLNGTSE